MAYERSGENEKEEGVEERKGTGGMLEVRKGETEWGSLHQKNKGKRGQEYEVSV